MEGVVGERERAHNDCICTSHPSLFTTCTLKTTKIGKRHSFGQALKSAANAVKWTRVRVLSLARWASRPGQIDRARQRVEMLKYFRIKRST